MDQLCGPGNTSAADAEKILLSHSATQNPEITGTTSITSVNGEIQAVLDGTINCIQVLASFCADLF